MKPNSLKISMTCGATPRIMMMGRLSSLQAWMVTDCLRRSFGSVLDIVPLADSVTKLRLRFVVGGLSSPSGRPNETQTELIGGADVYMPVCRQHYVDGAGPYRNYKDYTASK